MTDIDFDELDKAVNSLMNTASAPKKNTAQSSESSEASSSAAQSSAATTVEPHATQPAIDSLPVHVPERVAQTQSLTTPAKKRSGRFMDMVHPSADMAKRTATAPVSRKGVTITPPSEPVVAEASSLVDASTTTTADETSSTVSTESSVVEEHTMPDPLEAFNNLGTSEPEVASESSKDISSESTSLDTSVSTESEPESESESEPETDTDAGADESTVATDDPMPSDSPFIADAKVEKRPLGGEQQPENQPPNEGVTLPVEPQPEATDTKEQTDAKSSEPPTPAELNPDVVAVEANEPSAFARENEKMANDNSDDKTQAPHTGAIHQQYKEQASSGDASHTAIYDAANYPQTAAKKTKKKSGWLWVVWILLLLAVGAGGAVALYVMNIIP